MRLEVGCFCNNGVECGKVQNHTLSVQDLLSTFAEISVGIHLSVKGWWSNAERFA